MVSGLYQQEAEAIYKGPDCFYKKGHRVWLGARVSHYLIKNACYYLVPKLYPSEKKIVLVFGKKKNEFAERPADKIHFKHMKRIHQSEASVLKRLNLKPHPHLISINLSLYFYLLVKDGMYKSFKLNNPAGGIVLTNVNFTNFGLQRVHRKWYITQENYGLIG